MIFLLYNFMLTILAPLWVPLVYLKSVRRRAHPDWKQRCASYPDLPPKNDKKRLWFHAVSVGEVYASLPILKKIRKKGPGVEIFFTVTTPGGYNTAQDNLSEVVDHILYCPIDVARFQLSAMVAIRPDVVAVMESELWLNFFWAAKSVGAKTILIAGRMGDKSYKVNKKLSIFFKEIFKYIDIVTVQNDEYKVRLESLGAKDAKVIGNSKYDQAVENLDIDSDYWKSELNIPDQKPVIVVGSTRSELEEKIVLESLGKIGLDRINVVFAPRQLNRVESIQAEATKLGYHVALRSKQESSSFLILDTLGELNSVYSVADVVILGGGFDQKGGSNLLQPLGLGKPVVHGPYMTNFFDIVDEAEKYGATFICENADQISEKVQLLLGDKDLYNQKSKSAKEFVLNKTGASEKYAELIMEQLHETNKNLR